MKKIFLIIISILVLQTAFSQVVIHPTALFIDPKTKTGTLEVFNTSEEMNEYDVIFKFGYFTYDSLGNGYTRFDDNTAEQKYSLLPYIKAYPSKMMIPPKSSQVVRIVVRNVPNENQFYWTRIIVGANPIIPQIDTVSKDMVTAQIVLRSEIIGLVAYMNGQNESKLDMELDKVFRDTNGVNLMIRHKRGGNAPFWGMANMKILSEDGKTVLEQDLGLAIYFDCVQKVSLPADKLQPGKYKLHLFVTGERDEVPEEFNSKSFKPFSKTFDFTLN